MSAAVLMLVAAACPSALASSGATYARSGCGIQSSLSAIVKRKRLHEIHHMLQAGTTHIAFFCFHFPRTSNVHSPTAKDSVTSGCSPGESD
jgi:hypothetical protein